MQTLNEKNQSSHEQEFNLEGYGLEKIKTIGKNIGRFFFTDAISEGKKFEKYFLLLNGIPQFLTLGHNCIKSDQEQGCEGVYNQVASVGAFFAAITASMFAAAEMENTSAKIAEGIEVSIEIIDGLLEEKNSWEEDTGQGHHTLYKLLNILPKVTQQCLNIGFIITLCSEKLGETEVMTVGGEPITLKEVLPIINIGLATSLLIYRGSYEKIKNNRTFCQDINKSCCEPLPRIKIQRQRAITLPAVDARYHSSASRSKGRKAAPKKLEGITRSSLFQSAGISAELETFAQHQVTNYGSLR